MKRLIEIDLNDDKENDSWEVKIYHDGIYTASVNGPKITIGGTQTERTSTRLEFKK